MGFQFLVWIAFIRDSASKLHFSFYLGFLVSCSSFWLERSWTGWVVEINAGWKPSTAGTAAAWTATKVEIGLCYVEASLQMASFPLEGLVTIGGFNQILNFNDAEFPWSWAKFTDQNSDFEKASLAFKIYAHDSAASYLFSFSYYVFNNFVFICFFVIIKD